MDILTTDFITGIVEIIDPSINYHNTTIAYIKYLITPYATVLDESNNVEAIKQWFSLVIKDANDLSSLIRKTNRATNIQTVKGVFLMYLIDKLARESVTSYDDTVLPWDVQAYLNESSKYPFSKLFNGIAYASDTLPVDIVIDGQQYEYMLTLNFTCGLLLFSAPEVGHQ